MVPDARCIQGLAREAVEDGQELRDWLVDWGKDLAELTTKLSHEEYDDRDQFYGKILRTARGLAGTIISLSDIAMAQWL